MQLDTLTLNVEWPSISGRGVCDRENHIIAVFHSVSFTHYNKFSVLRCIFPQILFRGTAEFRGAPSADHCIGVVQIGVNRAKFEVLQTKNKVLPDTFTTVYET